MVSWRLVAFCLSWWCGLAACLTVEEKAEPATDNSLLHSKGQAQAHFELHGAPTGTYILVPKRGPLPCEGGHSHFAWSVEAGAYVTDPVPRNYAAIYTVCKLTEEHWMPVAEVGPQFINTMTLAPLTLFCFLFVSLCTIFRAPSGSLVILLATTVLARALVHLDLCYTDREMLLLIFLLVGTLSAVRAFPLQSLAGLPVLVAGAAYAAQPLLGTDLFRADCLRVQPTGFVKEWTLNFLRHFGVPWLTKLALERIYPSGPKQCIPLIAGMGLALLSYLGLPYHSLATAVLLVALALNEQRAATAETKLEDKGEGEAPGMVTRARSRSAASSTPPRNAPPPPPARQSLLSRLPVTPPSFSKVSQRVLSPFKGFKREGSATSTEAPAGVSPSQPEPQPQPQVVQVGSAPAPPSIPKRAPPPVVVDSGAEEGADDTMLLDSPSRNLRKRKMHRETSPSKKSATPKRRGPSPHAAIDAAGNLAEFASTPSPGQPLRRPAKRSHSSPTVGGTKRPRP